MIALQNWNTQGVAKHKFSLIQTYPSSADKFVYNLGIKLFDNQGNGYYTSFPPFSILAPYFLISLLSSDFTVLNLQRFNLAGHFVATLALYWLLCRTLSRAQPFPPIACLVGAIAFVFAAPNLWYYSNIYSWDTFWHYLWIIGLLCVMKIHDEARLAHVNPVSLFALGFISFLVTYSEYQGLLFAASVALWGFWKSKQSGGYMKVALTATGATLLAVTITMFQYSSLAGPDAFVQSVLQTAKMRSFSGEFYWTDILRHYERVSATYFCRLSS